MVSLFGIILMCVGLVVVYQAITGIRRELSNSHSGGKVPAGLWFLPGNVATLLRTYRSVYPQGQSGKRVTIGAALIFFGFILMFVGGRTG